MWDPCPGWDGGVISPIRAQEGVKQNQGQEHPASTQRGAFTEPDPDTTSSIESFSIGYVRVRTDP